MKLLTSLWSELEFKGAVLKLHIIAVPVSLLSWPSPFFLPATWHIEHATVLGVRTYVDDPKTILENHISLFTPSEAITTFLKTRALKFLRARANLTV